MLCWYVDRKTSFGYKNGPRIGAKTVPNRVQNTFGRVLNEDRISILKKEMAGSIGRAAPRIRVSTNRRILDLRGEGNREGADGFNRLTSLASKGSADHRVPTNALCGDCRDPQNYSAKLTTVCSLRQ